MPVITLTTDWNKYDYYVGTVKGKILNRCPGVTIVDISHQVQSFNIAQAAFILRNTYAHFPAGTVHMIGVESMVDPVPRHLLISADDHFFVGADNGLFGLLFKNDPGHIIELKGDGRQDIFPMGGVLLDAACRLVNGERPETIGTPVDRFNKRVPMRATIEESVITGSIIYIDSYQNAIVNITEELFNRVRKKRNFDIFIQSNHYRISALSATYAERPVGEIVVLFNSLGLMEIGINHGRAAELLNLSTGSTIRVKFKE